MTSRLLKQIEEASRQQLALNKSAQEEGGYAFKLASLSMQSHIEELSQAYAIEASSSIFEHVELRLIASQFSDGSASLDLIAKLSDSFRHMIGYAALRLTTGGITKKRIPKHLYQDLDLRMLALLPGSSRMVISANSNRDFFNDGIAKGSFERVFAVLLTNGEGDDFMEKATDLGPQSSIWLRKMLDVIIAESADFEIAWRFRGETICAWQANQHKLTRLSAALASTEVTTTENQLITGTIELLSKRERVHILSGDGDRFKILYPKDLLPAVAKLHLDQVVSLRCAVIEARNPLTDEITHSFELLEVVTE